VTLRVSTSLQLIFNRQNANDVEKKPVPYVGLRICVVPDLFPVILSGRHQSIILVELYLIGAARCDPFIHNFCRLIGNVDTIDHHTDLSVEG